MLSQSQYDKCVIFCRDIYKKEKIVGATYVSKKISGFYALKYEDTDAIYLIFKGTDGLFGLNDWLANFLMLIGFAPKQFKQALSFVKSNFVENKQIVVCGHSLGGAIAQFCVVNIEHDHVSCLNFNPAGIRHILKPKKYKLYEDNIWNIVTHRDILYRLTAILPFNWMKNIGKTLIIQDDVSWNGIKSHSNWNVFEEYKF